MHKGSIYAPARQWLPTGGIEQTDSLTGRQVSRAGSIGMAATQAT